MAYLITENCTGCAACARRCPTGAITGLFAHLHAVDPRRCIDCGVCVDEAIVDDEGYVCAALDPARWSLAHVDAASCTGCRLCVWSCPFEALWTAPVPGSHFGVAAVIIERCVGCAICELDCPYDAIRVLGGEAGERRMTETAA